MSRFFCKIVIFPFTNIRNVCGMAVIVKKSIVSVLILTKPILYLHRFFRVIPAASFLQTFASDRSHMLNDDGKYMEMPPDYPPIKTQGKWCYFCSIALKVKQFGLLFCTANHLEKPLMLMFFLRIIYYLAA